ADQAVTRLAAAHGMGAAKAILKTLRVQPFRNTQIVAINVDAGDPALAAEAANAVVASLIEMDLNARRRWAREMREFIEPQLAGEEIDLSGLRQQFTPKHPMVLNVAGKIAETRQRLDAELARSLQPEQYGVDPVYQQLIQQLRQDEVQSAALDARDQALAAAIDQYEGTIKQLPVREVVQARPARD